MQREPAFNAPWPAAAIAASILGAYLVQTRAGSAEAIYARLGFSPAALAAGRWNGLITALYVHGGWAHAGMNALGALAFGAPVARRLGTDATGALGFFGLYFACGVAASLGFALVHPGSAAVLVGASGAVSGLMGAASRLLIPPGAALAPYLSSNVVGMATAWLIVNLLLAAFGLGVVAGGAPVAWEAHLFGYAAGLVAIGPLLALARRADGKA